MPRTQRGVTSDQRGLLRKTAPIAWYPNWLNHGLMFVMQTEAEEGDTMKKCCVLLTVLYLVIAGTTLAQQLSSHQTKTEVPFDFVVDGTMLPAGTYGVTFYTDGRGFTIQNRDNPNYVRILIRNNEIRLLPNGKTHDTSAMVFSLSNGQRVLHQIKVEGDNHTHDIVHGTDVAELALNH